MGAHVFLHRLLVESLYSSQSNPLRTLVEPSQDSLQNSCRIPLGVCQMPSLRNVWGTFGKRFRNVWGTFEERLRNVWWTFEERLGDVWGKSEERLSNVWRTFEERLRNVWGTFEERLRNGWGTFEERLVNVWGTFEERFRGVSGMFEERLSGVERSGVGWSGWAFHSIGLAISMKTLGVSLGRGSASYKQLVFASNRGL